MSSEEHVHDVRVLCEYLAYFENAWSGKAVLSFTEKDTLRP